MANLQSSSRNPWNPFISTKRDLQRTNNLANKKIAIVLILGLLFSPILSALYLNRGLNTLKILGYLFALSMFLDVNVRDEETYWQLSLIGGALGGISMVAEQSLSVKNARLRKNY